MKYSVIIPARNEEKNIPRTIESLQAQTIPPQEVVLINDNSTDLTAEIAKDYGCTVVDFPEKHENWVTKKELAKVFNFGLKEFDNQDLDYVMVLGADHILTNDYVEQLYKKMTENNNMVGSGSIGDEFAVTPRGSGRLIDYQWFAKLGLRYPVKYGYESYLVMKSMQQGYEKGYYPEIKSTTQRKTAVTYRPIMYYQYGQAYKALGYPAHYTLLRGMILLKKRKALSMVYFFVGFLFSSPPFYEDDLRQYVKERQGIKLSHITDREKVKNYLTRLMKS